MKVDPKDHQQLSRGRVCVDVAVLEFDNGGRTIWVHDASGATVLRIAVRGGAVRVNSSCSNICAHADLQVQGDVEFCIPEREEYEQESSIEG